MPTPQSISECLRKLHDEYTHKVNIVLDEGREDLARQLSDAHAEQALQLIAEQSGPAADHAA